MARLRKPKHRISRSDEIRSAFALAVAEANRLNQSAVGTEHILMGIARLPESRGAAMLTRLGKDREEVVRDAERLALTTGATTDPSTQPGPRGDPTRAVLTAAAMRAVDAAYAEVDAVGATEVGSDFMIVGLLVEGRGIAAQVLAHLGVTLEGARVQLDPGIATPRRSPEPPVRRERLPRRKWNEAHSSPSRSSRHTEELLAVFKRFEADAGRRDAAPQDTQELLLAIARTPDCDAARLLQQLGVDLESLVREVERVVPPSAIDGGRGEGRRSGALMRAVWVARNEWRMSRRERMDSTHLLLGLLIEGTGIAATVLGRFGVTLERVRAALPAAGGTPGPAFRVLIDDRSDLSIYEQIIARVQEAIATGALKPGERLLPVRQLADDLDIAPGTVARAYSELEARGVVVTEGARGTRVAEQVRSGLSTEARHATLVEMLRPVAVEAFHLGASAADLHAALDAAAQDIRGERSTS